ncbi:DUF4012 domain-containing protein [Candidatus Uhrbacteria bacterium]|nr:DUF4012 domain-containing protein [Candidatus Uhrbacteria bacterium]
MHEASNLPHRRRVPTWVPMALVVFVGVLVGGALILVSVTGNAVLDGRDAWARARTAFENADILRAQEELSHAKKSFDRAYGASRFLSPLAYLPLVGDSVRPLRVMIKTGADVSGVFADALGEILEVFRLVPEAKDLWPWQGRVGSLLALWPDIDEATRGLLLSRLRALVPSLELAKADIAVVKRIFEEETTPLFLGPLENSKEKLAEAIETLSSVLEEAVGWAAIGPELAGADGESRVLIFLLNNSELRPGGGFMGSFAVATLRAGLLTELQHFDVMALDGAATPVWNAAPPGPLAEYLGVPAWYLRDANWSPDVPTSFAKALAFYMGEQNAGGARAVSIPTGPFTAVLGVTVTFAQDLLRVVGPVTVEGETFTAENIPEDLNESVEFGFVSRGQTPAERKNIIGSMLREVADRVAELSPDGWNYVLSVAKERVAQKHLMLYSEDAKRQDLFARYGLTGTLSPPAVGEDALMVVDANLAALKTDPAIERHLTYTIEPQPNGEIHAIARMQYRHTQTFSKTITRYRTFTRFYVPAGSELVQVEGSLRDDKLKNPGGTPDTPEISDELGYRVFGFFTSVEPLSEKVLTVRYKLPAPLVERMEKGEGYRLSVLKQPGTPTYGLTLDLSFDTTLVHANPPEEQGEWGDRRYRLNTNVDQDRAYVVELSAKEDRD